MEHQILKPVRDPETGHAISPVIAAALCIKHRGKITADQAQKVDARAGKPTAVTAHPTTCSKVILTFSFLETRRRQIVAARFSRSSSRPKRLDADAPVAEVWSLWLVCTCSAHHCPSLVLCKILSDSDVSNGLRGYA